MQKISLLQTTRQRPQSESFGRKNAEVLTKKPASGLGSGRNVKKINPSEGKTSLAQRSRIRLDTKSSILRKPHASKSESKTKRTSEASPTKKGLLSNMAVDRCRSMVDKISTQKAAISKKEKPKRNRILPEITPNSINIKKTHFEAKERSAAESEFKRKFNSIMPKAIHEPKIPNLTAERPGKVTEREAAPPILKTSIFSNSKLNDKSTLQIETWGTAQPQPPKPLFNISKSVKLLNMTERKSMFDKSAAAAPPRNENLAKRASKNSLVIIKAAAVPPMKPIVSKIWKF